MPVKPEELPLGTYHFVDRETALELTHENAIWRCDLTAYQCVKKQALTPQDDDFDESDSYDFTPRAVNGDAITKPSPDGKSLAWVENYNVVARPRDAKPGDAKQRIVLSTAVRLEVEENQLVAGIE
jgi:hypothetical protein